jgi:chromosomal replication initiator protein
VKSSRRKRELTYARHVAMYLMRNDASMTFAAIARLMGKKDHSTVVHACNQLERDLCQSPELRADLDAIRSTFHNSITAA